MKFSTKSTRYQLTILTQTERPLDIYIGITVDGICHRQSASSGRTVLTFKVNVQQAEVSKTAIWHAQANSFPKGRTIF